MKKSKLFLPILFLLFLAGCTSDNAANFEAERANAPWVFRSVMDSQARMITLALNDNLWATYSAETGALDKVWKGSVNFDGAVYTTVHGPQPSSIGNYWFKNKYTKPFTIQQGGQDVPTTVQYRGHRFDKGQVWLNYEILLSDGKKITISERPEYVSKTDGTVGFERTFVTENVPSGTDIILSANVGSISLKNSIVTDGEWAIRSERNIDAMKLSALELDGTLKLKANGSTNFTTFFTKKPMYINGNKVEGAEDEEERPLGYRLIARSDCKTCHNTFVKTIGPSYMDVAAKYRNNEGNVAMLIDKVKNGGSGVWGETVMSPHADLAETSIKEMITYIMGLDKEEEAELALAEATETPKDLVLTPAAKDVNGNNILPGAIIKVFLAAEGEEFSSVKDVPFDSNPIYSGVIGTVEAEGNDFGELQDHFGMLIEGYLNIPKDNNYTFRLISDDGSVLYIDGNEVINHDGPHGMSAVDGEMALSKGYHPFRIEFYQGAGGKGLRFQWTSFDGGGFKTVPATLLVHNTDKTPKGGGASPMASKNRIAGDGFSLETMHPSYTLSQARPASFTPKVGGMDFLPDGRLAVSTWDAEGCVYLVENPSAENPEDIKVKKIASGLAEPLGLKVVDNVIYVLQKQELTRLIDTDGDDVIDEYYTLSNDWQTSANFHEFAFGLAYKNNNFYATLATAIEPGGASTQPQIQDRGRVVQINKETGKANFIAHGLRTPNGIGLGVDNELFVADNQGDWLPSCKILHVTEGAFFGSHSVDPEGTKSMKEKPPVVWLPQDEIGNSPSSPSLIPEGIFKGQMTHGEVTHGGLKRVFVEKINGEYQGVVFRFIQGLEAGVNRHVWGPDGAVYIGGIGSTGNWLHTGKLWYGLQRVKYNKKPSFEMLAVRAKSNGMEIELTEALPSNIGWDASEYKIQQWWYLPTENYGGPKMDLENLKVLSVNISEDRKKIFLELDGMKKEHVVYIKLPGSWNSEKGNEMWATEAWYTLNNIPENTAGFKSPTHTPLALNTLSEEEKTAGWVSLFDGKTTTGWRNFRKETIGSSWIVKDGALMLNSVKKDDGGWQAANGGDIITDKSYENFELNLEWKIASCGNSGIIYNVVENEKFDYVWQTGPEMQVLDNTCHPDAKIPLHRAGDLYDMLECKVVVVKPAGEWNKIRLIKKDGKVEHWLNGRKVVEFEMYTEKWNKMITNSKFKDMKGFGLAKEGHISLQDHGDRVWYRNIKIKEL